MTSPTIRRALPEDKPIVLDFCQDTFSWGDYIDQVWDHWLNHGHLLIYDVGRPVGMCHCSTTKSQLWFEGVRVSPNFRRRGIAKQLLSYTEQLGLKEGAQTSSMLVESNNTSSIAMAKSMKYEILGTWNFYTLHSNHNNTCDSTDHIKYTKQVTLASDIDDKYPYYVDSWRWLKLDDDIVQRLVADDNIIRCTKYNNESIGIITKSDAFDSVIVTLFSDSQDTVTPIISYLQDYIIQNEIKSIHIATTSMIKTYHTSLKSTFYLLGKHL